MLEEKKKTEQIEFIFFVNIIYKTNLVFNPLNEVGQHLPV
jgi:hypothetical protein